MWDAKTQLLWLYAAAWLTCVAGDKSDPPRDDVMGGVTVHLLAAHGRSAPLRLAAPSTTCLSTGVTVVHVSWPYAVAWPIILAGSEIHPCA